MKIIEIPMYRKSGTRVQLKELLSVMPDKNMIWSILEFDGVGKMPDGISVADFDKRLRTMPIGLVLTLQEILKFSEAIEQCNECLIAAVWEEADLDSDRLFADDFSQCEIALRAFDSTSWTVASRDDALFEQLVGISTTH